MNAKWKYLLVFLLTGWSVAHVSVFFSNGSRNPSASSNEWVILLHGLGRTRFSMNPMARYLADKGYQTVNVSYPSTKKSIESIVEEHLVPAVAGCGEKGARKIHFVTHSMGGIVLRCYLERHNLPEGSRAVMLSPPNQGSELADFLKENVLFRWLLGPAAQQIGTGPDSLPNRMDASPGIDVGIIMGDTGIPPIFGAIFPGPNDGKVSVERAKLAGMKAFKRIPCGHTFIMNRKDVMAAADQFLRRGTFSSMTTM